MCPFHELGKCCECLYFRSQVQGTIQNESLCDTAVFCHHFIVFCWSVSIVEWFCSSIFTSLSVVSSAIFPSSVYCCRSFELHFFVSVILLLCLVWLSGWLGSALLHLFVSAVGIISTGHYIFLCRVNSVIWSLVFPYTASYVGTVRAPIVELFNIVHSKFCCSCFFIKRSRILFCSMSNIFSLDLLLYSVHCSAETGTNLLYRSTFQIVSIFNHFKQIFTWIHRLEHVERESTISRKNSRYVGIHA